MKICHYSYVVTQPFYMRHATNTEWNNHLYQLPTQYIYSSKKKKKRGAGLSPALQLARVWS